MLALPACLDGTAKSEAFEIPTSDDGNSESQISAALDDDKRVCTKFILS